ncbi:MAG: hypothetical protein ABI921_00555 [Panacibacter sp.]
MSKIIYHKNCRQHEAVAKVKRMLHKIEKQFGGFQGTFYCNIQLTGVNDIDRREVKSYVEQHLKELKRKIDKQLLQNEKLVNGEWNESYEEGYYTPTFTEQLQIIEALNKVHSFIWSEYPEIEIKKSEPFVFTAENPAAKYEEAKRYFLSNPVVGFLQETFGIFENGVSRKLYPLTFSSYDLQNAKSVYVQYQ